MTANRRVVLSRHLEGRPKPEDFNVVDGEPVQLGEGQILGRALYLSLDPYIRGALSGRHMGHAKTDIGDVIPGRCLLRVEESVDGKLQQGDLVVAESGWQEWAALDPDACHRVVPSDAPLSTYLGIMGMPGLTAYAGMKRLAKPMAGETVVVSAASGPVGSMVGQIARLNGCRVVGIAGSDQKCRFLREDLHFDGAINYKSQDLATALAEACPDGIDVYFDNVGGATLAAACTRLALHARIVLCGLISQYNTDRPPPGPNMGPIIGARAEMKGLVVYDHLDLTSEFQRVAGRWLADGQLRYKEDLSVGLDAAPAAFARLMSGENFGKAIVKIAD